MTTRSGILGRLAALAASLAGTNATAEAETPFDSVVQDCIRFVRSQNQQLPEQWKQDFPPEETDDEDGSETFGEAIAANGTIRVLHRAFLATDKKDNIWTCDLDAADRADIALAQAFADWAVKPGLATLEETEVKETQDSVRRFYLDRSEPASPVYVQLVQPLAPGKGGNWLVNVELSSFSMAAGREKAE